MRLLLNLSFLFFLSSCASLNLEHCKSLGEPQNPYPDLCENLYFKGRNKMLISVDDSFKIPGMERLYQRDSTSGQTTYFSSWALLWNFREVFIQEKTIGDSLVIEIDYPKIDSLNLSIEDPNHRIEKKDGSYLIHLKNDQPLIYFFSINPKFFELREISIYSSPDYISEKIDVVDEFLLECFLWDREIQLIEYEDHYTVYRPSDGRETVFPKDKK